MDSFLLTRAELDEMIRDGLESADDSVQTAWHALRIEPERWQCSPWGDDFGGFWIVAEKDGYVVWYNEIEGGFNTSRFETRGTIAEYWCNQDSFEYILSRLPEAVAAENRSDDLSTQFVPADLQLGGTIVRRQTTYWTLRANNDTLWRLHFKSKSEVRYVERHFLSMAIAAEHPILSKYIEPWADLYYTGSLPHSDKLMRTLNAKCLAVSDNWRTIDEYVNQSADRAVNGGLFVRAPISIAQLVAAELGSIGIKTSSLSCNWMQATTATVAVLGQNFIVAERFRCEKQTN